MCVSECGECVFCAGSEGEMVVSLLGSALLIKFLQCPEDQNGWKNTLCVYVGVVCACLVFGFEG